MDRKVIAVFGGTFDPPHIGHLVAASDACEALALERVLFVPAARPPHKPGEVDTPPELRLRMVELAAAGDDRFDASDIEIGRDGPSFTIDTVRELKGDDFETVYVIVGADGLAEMTTWKEYRALLDEARVVAVSRPGFDFRSAEFPDAGAVRYLEVTPIGVSSTMIRKRVAAGRSIRYLVPEVIEDFIYEEGLYVESD
ncbi:MAG: nicotinate-nucleotide adenylyltransferase [Candidatus Coatesbacteria bacterium]|nr:MAG: nicotinate-nucleotide adenylyltransferase [Candidatus Coatesbacteria bacterium]